MSNKLLWVCVVGLTCLTVYNKANEYRPPEKREQAFLSAPAGRFTGADGKAYAAFHLLFADGTTGWSAQPVVETNETAVLKLK
jgi:hypothetical protein